MTCPICNGTGRVPKRFLWLFSLRVRCPGCSANSQPSPSAFRDDSSVGSFSSAAHDRGRQDDFTVGSGGRSGGGGGGASWAPEDGKTGTAAEVAEQDMPLVADPFRDESMSTADVASTADTGSSGDGDSSSSTDSSGTSY